MWAVELTETIRASPRSAAPAASAARRPVASAKWPRWFVANCSSRVGAQVAHGEGDLGAGSGQRPRGLGAEPRRRAGRSAANRALEQDLHAAERLLATPGAPLPDRLVDAFDQWAGRYIGPLSQDIPAGMEQNPGLLGEFV
jgi:hypothetical protein